MKKVIAAVLFTALGFGVLGCNSFPWTRDRGGVASGGGSDGTFAKREPTAAELVAYLNDNARRVQAVKCTKVAVDCKQGNETPVGFDGMLMCEKPRNFRLKGKAVGKDVVDIGSNGDEFWFWITDPRGADAPVYHCAYNDMKAGQARLPFPFNPDMVVCALNIAEYRPDANYTVRAGKDVIELIEPTKSLQGQDIYKVTVFNRGQVTATKPRVLAYVLKDKQGKDICSAAIVDTQLNRETGAVLPVRVKIVFNGEKASEKSEMTMVFDGGLQPTTIPKESYDNLFTRKDLSHLPSYDLARGADKPTGMSQSFQRTVGTDR
jgi:hypothetical protein